MRTSIRNLTLLATAAVAVAVAVAPAHAAKPKKVKACALATPGQVQMVLGEPVAPGTSKKVAAANTEQCLFRAKSQPAALLILQVTSGSTAAVSYRMGRDSLPSHAISGIGQKAYQVDESGAIGFLYKRWYVIVQPPGTIAASLDLSQMPALAKVAASSLKSYA